MHLILVDLFLQNYKDPNQLKVKHVILIIILLNSIKIYIYYIFKYLKLPTESLWINTFNGGCLINKFPINAAIIFMSVGGAINESLAIRLTNAATSSSGK